MNKTSKVGLLCLFLCLSFAGIAFAQIPVTGVSKGNTFSYRCFLLGSHNQSSSWSLWVPERNQSIWSVTVDDVNASRITYNLQVLLTNGTQESFISQYLDLFSGGSNGPNFMFFVSSNLNLSSRVYPGSDGFFVLDSALRSYASGQRETNHVSFSGASDNWDVYIDKSTGVMVELSSTFIDRNATFSLKLMDSSAWLVSTPTASSTIAPTISPKSSPTLILSASPSLASPIISPSSSIPEFPLFIALSLIVAVTALISAFKKIRAQKL